MKPDQMKFHTPLYLAADLRQLEQAHAGQPLMERAGRAIANYVQTLLPDVQSSVLLVAGPGNNGGDAFVAARLLQDIYRVALVFCGDIDKLPAMRLLPAGAGSNQAASCWSTSRPASGIW